MHTWLELLKSKLYLLTICYVWEVGNYKKQTTNFNPCPGNGGVFLPPSAVLAENRQLNNGLKHLVFVTLSQTLLAF